jgi:hypothetical protein
MGEKRQREIELCCEKEQNFGKGSIQPKTVACKLQSFDIFYMNLSIDSSAILNKFCDYVRNINRML